ncbi:MAG TPA: BTAD domain-containing putative transcriptional regulator [Pseudonocardiaceae bacterium]
MFAYAGQRPSEHEPREAADRYADVLPLSPRAATAPSHAGEYDAVPDAGRRQIELRLLGGFRLLVGGELVPVGLTGQRLLAVVACRGRQATRKQIAQALWPDATSARAHANLRTALYRLVRSCPEAVHVTSSYLQLTVGMRIDLEQTTRLATHILSTDIVSDQAVLSDALRANFYEDLLPEWDDEWLGDHQYRYRQLRLTTLETLSSRLAAAGNHGAAVQTALAAVQADSLRDSAHETLIRACLAQGNRNEALTHYLTYSRILREELGLDPPANLGLLLTSA